MDDPPAMRLSRRDFLDLPEYSCSLPTGTTPGKRWRRLNGSFDPRARLPLGHPQRIQPRWLICEYGDVSPDGKTIAIKIYRAVISVRADA